MALAPTRLRSAIIRLTSLALALSSLSLPLRLLSLLPLTLVLTLRLLPTLALTWLTLRCHRRSHCPASPARARECPAFPSLRPGH